MGFYYLSMKKTKTIIFECGDWKTQYFNTISCRHASQHFPVFLKTLKTP